MVGDQTRPTTIPSSSSPTIFAPRSPWRAAPPSTSSIRASRPPWSRRSRRLVGADVRLSGGASVIQQYLHAGLVDELHVAVAPVLLGAGERLFDNLEGVPDGYECVEFVG